MVHPSLMNWKLKHTWGFVYPIAICADSAGYPCHEPHYNATKCEYVRANYFDSYMRADNPGSMQNDNWEDQDEKRCAFEATASSPCQQGRVSILGVQAETVDDIQKALRFAAKKNLRIVVKSSGHDWLGRSAAPGSFLLWMHKMKKNITIDYGFTAIGRCEASNPVPAVTVVGGVAWGEVYDVLKPTGYIAVGGMSLTICASGGYLQGGGHSVFGPSFGLAVDNVLQIEVVTADGTLHRVSACRDPELFFALRGGGGGTFGVVTSVTYKLHKNPSNLVGAVLMLSPSNGTATWSLTTQEAILVAWSRTALAMDAARWGGYWFFNTASFAGYFLAPTTKASANATISPLLQALSQIDHVATKITLFDTPTFQDWHYAIYPTQKTKTDYTGGRNLLGSRIVPYSALADPQSLARQILAAMAVAGPYGVLGNMVIGPGVRDGAPHNLKLASTAVTPAWRRGIWHLLTQSSWDWNAPHVDTVTAQNETLAFVKVLQEAYPDSGAYFNEASVDEPGWQQSFWGYANYARLLAVKLRVDPSGLFTCRNCVGSEQWDKSGTCRI